MPRQITKESTAWRLVAKEIAVNTSLVGLCETLDLLCDEVKPVARDVMKKRIRQDIWARRLAVIGDAFEPFVSVSWAYTFPGGTGADGDMTRGEQRDARILAALLFAEEAASEGR